NFYNDYLLYKTVENGNNPEPDVSEDMIVPRLQTLASLMDMFQPQGKHLANYHVVVGEHGTGKTTLSIIAARKVGRGVIYVKIKGNTEDLEGLGNALGKAINFKESVSLTGYLTRKIMGSDSIQPGGSKWESALDAFERAAAVYKKKYKQPPVLVFDNISVLSKSNPKILDQLQENAKESADEKKYIVVFVTSDGSVPKRMLARSAWSRAGKDILEIGDLTENEAIDYLTNKHKVCNDTEAKKLYELIGGRLATLNYAALSKLSYEEIKKAIFIELERKFSIAEIDRGQLNHKKAKQILKALLQSNDKEISYRILQEMAEGNTVLDTLLSNNILSYHL
ncbi:20780_t:CDS:2, partial [Gigaspora rosea]